MSFTIFNIGQIQSSLLWSDIRAECIGILQKKKKKTEKNNNNKILNEETSEKVIVFGFFKYL